MIFLRGPLGGVISCLLCLGLTGCFLSGENQLDEQKEPHFLTGKKRMNSLDHKGAVEAFEKALEINPRSASAHFELALLFEQKEDDYAAAVYLYGCPINLITTNWWPTTSTTANKSWLKPCPLVPSLRRCNATWNVCAHSKRRTLN